MNQQNKIQFTLKPLHLNRIKSIIKKYELTESEFFRLVSREIILFDDMGISIYDILSKIQDVVKAIHKKDS